MGSMYAITNVVHKTYVFFIKDQYDIKLLTYLMLVRLSYKVHLFLLFHYVTVLRVILYNALYSALNKLLNVLIVSVKG